ncbi:MAG: hypothetical protein JNJ54_25795 [Myxococcaceae bacterium]|nr:hypothetical protein [Myxococcaceae bacterium]
MVRLPALVVVLVLSSCQCGPGGVSVTEPRRGGGVAGGSVAGGSVAGGSVAGGSAAGGSAAGGSVAGGFVAGGSAAGGSVAGGFVAGGSAAGGSAAGGSSAGGSSAGGSAGGSSAGGSSAGGATAGGSVAGGSAAGGTGDAGFVEVVYGHSADTLYALDPVTKAVRRVGSFSCAFDITDLAIDGQGNAFIVGFSGFYRLDLTNAACTAINTVLTYPNSLSFVPKGTLDPNVEVLVAYSGRFYNRINTTTGAMQQIGSGLPSGFESSGDIVSVQDGGTFLTVKNMFSNPMCDDCLLQVNPVTGGLIRNYGPIPYTNVYGIAYWGGAVYGFTQAGQLFEIGPNGTGIITRPITIPNAPPGLSFNGAGSSTAVPVFSRDGGGISID